MPGLRLGPEPGADINLSTAHRRLLLFALGALLLSAILVFRGGWAPGAIDPASADGGAEPGTFAPASGRVSTEDSRQVSRMAMPAGSGSSERGHRERFEHATDLYAFASTLATAARAGDPEAAWMLSRVYEYCSSYAAGPAGYAGDTQAISDTGALTSAARVAARTRVSTRCSRFAPADELSYTVILAITTDAAEAGNLAAEAALLAIGEPLYPADEYRSGLVERVRESRDPEAYVALAPAMGIRASGDRAFSEQVAGTQLAEVAWQVAACELGMDCSADSVLMTDHCANGGICSRDPGQDFRSFVFDAAVPKQGSDVVDEMVKSLTGDRKVPR